MVCLPTTGRRLGGPWPLPSGFPLWGNPRGRLRSTPAVAWSLDHVITQGPEGPAIVSLGRSLLRQVLLPSSRTGHY